jgi:hypothetical protein
MSTTTAVEANAAETSTAEIALTINGEAQHLDLTRARRSSTPSASTFT